MEEDILNDKSIAPSEEIIFSIIGDTKLLWKQTFSYLFDNSKDISVNWKYSDCGKYWVCVVVKKKNTIFRIRILKKNSFHIIFPVGNKLEPVILQSELHESIKNVFADGKKYNTTRYISIDMKDTGDFENAKKLIDIKLKN